MVRANPYQYISLIGGVAKRDWNDYTSRLNTYLPVSSDGVDYIQFNLTPTHSHSEGAIHWDDDDKTLNIDTEVTGTAIQVGQEQVLRVTNKTGVTITNGQIVYVNGAQGSRPTVALADADVEAQADTTIGMCTSDIDDDKTGYITTYGLVRDVNTNAYTAGTTLYLSQTAGEYTDTAPASPAHSIRIGYVIHQSETEGIILISIDTGTDLKNAHDVLITGLADGDHLQYNSSSQLWENVALDTFDEWEAVGNELRPKSQYADDGVVIGTPVEEFTATGDDVTGDYENAGASISYSTDHWENDVVVAPISMTASNILSGGGTVPGYLVDDNVSTISYDCDVLNGIIFDFGSAKNIGQLDFYNQSASYRNTAGIILSVSNDNVTYSNSQAFAITQNVWNYLTYTPGSYRYLKLVNNGGSALLNIREIKIYSSDYASTNNTIESVLHNGSAVSLDISTLTVEDENGTSITSSGKVNADYDLGSGFTGSLVDLQTLKAESDSTFSGITYFSIKLQPVGNQQITDTSVQTISTNIKLEKSGKMSINVSGNEVFSNTQGVFGDIVSYDAHPTFTVDEEIVDKKYVDDTIISVGDATYLRLDTTNDPLTAGLEIDGSADEVQLKISGHSTQTSNVLEIENSATTKLLELNNSGKLTVTDGFIKNGLAYLDADTGTTESVIIGRTVPTGITGSYNFIAGSEAGASITSASQNVFLGRRAGKLITTESNNVAIGVSAMSGATATANVAIGLQALTINTGGYSVALGNQAGLVVTSGSRNCFIGSESGRGVTTGNDNFAFGYRTIYTGDCSGTVAIGTRACTTTPGNYTVAVGYYANYTGVSGYSVFLGYKAGYNENTANRLYIANSDTSTPLIYGEFDNNLLKIHGDLKIPSDTYKFFMGAGDDISLEYDGTDAKLNTGLVTPSDFVLDCGANKTLELAEAVWDDMQIDIGAVKLPPANSASIVLNPAGSVGLAIQFENGFDQSIHFNMQSPHARVDESDIELHFHVTPGASTNTGNVYIQIDYDWQNIDGTYGAPTTVYKTFAMDGTAHKHQYENLASISGTGKSCISSIICCKVTRLGTHENDTFTGDLYAVGLDFHVKKNTQGSRQETVK